VLPSKTKRKEEEEEEKKKKKKKKKKNWQPVSDSTPNSIHSSCKAQLSFISLPYVSTYTILHRQTTLDTSRDTG
jgi:hypothetical protein